MIYPFSSYLYKDEAKCLEELLGSLNWDGNQARQVEAKAIDLVEKIRSVKVRGGQLEAFLQEFSLNTDEGLAMMTLAEALLRIPDHKTANELIRDKVAAANWLEKQGSSSKDWMTKAAGFGMALTRKTLDSSLARLGEPVIREAMIKAMQMMGRQFVLGTSVADAVSHAKNWEAQGYRISYDILGEGARDRKTADHYFQAYTDAIDYIGQQKHSEQRPGISIKLSALHPRYTYSQKERCVPEMIEKLEFLAHKAAHHNLTMTVDAEEAARLDLSLQIIEPVLKAKGLSGWEGFGLAVQAYQKRAAPLLDYLADVTRTEKRRIQVRLVKGAYWDTEVKRAQAEGFPDYPVFTRKCNTDVSYLACAKKMLDYKDVFYPMFGTHNAHTVAAILEMAHGADFEFQRLYGMGEGMYAHVLAHQMARVSIYAPVGPHKDLLPYLVRRLLENGANSSFVNQLLDKKKPAAEIVVDPVSTAMGYAEKRHPKIPLPADIYGHDRRNSKGLDLNDPSSSQETISFINNYQGEFKAFSVVEGKRFETAEEKFIDRCFQKASEAFPKWDAKGGFARAEVIERFADLLEETGAGLMAILAHEGGKTIPDALAEVREAIDFCRYYAARGKEDFSEQGLEMRGYTGESNHLTLRGRGVFVAISPWNFPLAIFTGQIVAALMAGNCVIAKPASQTRAIATRTVELMHKAGIPENVIQLLLGDGAYGSQMVAHPSVAGVVFTGSTATAKNIQKILANKDGPIVPFVAETGGQNAMIVDSSALIEQVVDDVILSAFGSAGQRCSALRVLYIQSEIADSFIEILRGTMNELSIGNNKKLSADIGPVIDKKAKQNLEEHLAYLKTVGTHIATAPPGNELTNIDLYFSPAAYEIANIKILKGEVFGPILHVIRYDSTKLQSVIEEINSTGFGLTFGMHSRIQSKQKEITSAVRAGNIYINRSMIGAVVGVQPFGGMGLSGTGPKAGGPYYLHAFATEKHISINTTAAGGNTSLIMMED